MTIDISNGEMTAAVGLTLPLTEKQIAAYRDQLSALPQVEPQTENYFVPQADGTFLYCRKVTRGADIATLGRVHKQEHLYVVAKGRIAIRGETSTTVHCAGDVIVSKAGTQRLVVSLEDSVTITMHRVSSMDIEEIERELVEEDLQSNYAPGNQVKQGILKHNDVERISP
jgi:hypothetical protein